MTTIKEIKEKVLEAKLAEQEGRQFFEVTGTIVALLKDFTKGVTSGGKDKYSGHLTNQEDVPFNVWSSSPAFLALESGNFVGGDSVIEADYNVSKYGFVLTRINLLENGPDADSFIHYKYDIHGLSVDFVNALNRGGISQKAKEVIYALLESGKDSFINLRFPLEQAAANHHDNCRTGLLAHILKCLKIYLGIKDLYPMFKDKRVNDLMVIGIIIHDIGKVFEMYNGVYQQYAYITHRGLGLEHLARYKDFIIERYDMDFYYMLYAIIQQHHDEYGERALTMYSYITHLIDDMDAKLTEFDQTIEEETYITDVSGTKVKIGDKYYNIMLPSEEEDLQETAEEENEINAIEEGPTLEEQVERWQGMPEEMKSIAVDVTFPDGGTGIIL